jgi:hypothetical protein
MILSDPRVWLLISYNVTRSLEGYEAFEVIRAEETGGFP